MKKKKEMGHGSHSVPKPSDIFSPLLKLILTKTTPQNNYVYDTLTMIIALFQQNYSPGN